MNNEFELLRAVRLKGKIDSAGNLQIVAVRDETLTLDRVSIRADGLPVRVELYDFDETTSFCTVRWEFTSGGPWQREDAEQRATAVFEMYDEMQVEIVASPQPQAGQDPPPKPKSKVILVDIEPIIIGPDET